MTQKTFYPKPLWAEQKPSDWWEAFCTNTKSLIEKTNIPIEHIECVSFSGHMNGVVLVDKYGNLLRENVFLWADSRSKTQAEYMENLIGYENFFNITGGGLDTVIYPSVKLLWIRENEPDIYKKIYKVLGTKDYIIFKLTGKYLTDYSDASSSGMMDIKKKVWSSEILDALSINKDILPDIYNSFELAGGVTEEASLCTGLMQGTKVVIGGGDVACP